MSSLSNKWKHWAVQSRFRVIYIYMHVYDCLWETHTKNLYAKMWFGVFKVKISPMFFTPPIPVSLCLHSGKTNLDTAPGYLDSVLELLIRRKVAGEKTEPPNSKQILFFFQPCPFNKPMKINDL